MKLLFLILILSVAGIQNLRSQHLNTSESGLAIEGYDPVSYYQEGPKKGSPSFTYKFNDATYRFLSKINSERFKNDPEMYIPAYGGWCAYAMGITGEKVKVDPETYKIINDRLYLFYNFRFNNTLKSWNKDEDSLKKQAELNWSKILAN
ncbi:MAG TPA: YHS domain-containing (seleno)protein [Cyclobacteriaceae bacterium]